MCLCIRQKKKQLIRLTRFIFCAGTKGLGLCLTGVLKDGTPPPPRPSESRHRRRRRGLSSGAEPRGSQRKRRRSLSFSQVFDFDVDVYRRENDACRSPLIVLKLSTYPKL